jgi:SAM-dependent methyltransferase
MLVISETDIKRHAPGDVLKAVVGQFVKEQGLKLRGVQFRTTHPPAVRAAYAAMDPREFDSVNARQHWANWRTIPRGMSGRVPNRSLRVIDLGCGTGSSTSVLACFCPAGSRILGLELSPDFVLTARSRSYRRSDGGNAVVEFHCQSITEPFCTPDAVRVPDASIQLVNASGVMGHHLEEPAVEQVVTEVARVLETGGLALLDCGPRLRPKTLAALAEPRQLREVGFVRATHLDLNGQLVFRRA